MLEAVTLARVQHLLANRGLGESGKLGEVELDASEGNGRLALAELVVPDA